MQRIALFFALCAVARGDCAPSKAVIKRMTARLRYENGLTSNRPRRYEFSFGQIGNQSYLRQETVGPNYDPTLRPVWVFEDDSGRMIAQANCPTAASFDNCVQYLSERVEVRSTTVPDASFCAFAVNVPTWVPSPESPEKRRIATELLSELRESGYEEAQRIFVRDFNLDDPDIIAYIQNRNGGEAFQGCWFSRDESPHCGWHMFGQSRLAGLRHLVMSRPYQLYPKPKRPSAARQSGMP